MFAVIVFTMATSEVVFGRKKKCWMEKVHLAITFSKIQLEDSGKWAALMPNGLKRRLSLGALRKTGRILRKHVAKFLKTTPWNLPSFEWKVSKGRFCGPDKLQNHTNQGKGRRKRKSEEEETGTQRLLSVKYLFGKKKLPRIVYSLRKALNF